MRRNTDFFLGGSRLRIVDEGVKAFLSTGIEYAEGNAGIYLHGSIPDKVLKSSLKFCSGRIEADDIIAVLTKTTAKVMTVTAVFADTKMYYRSTNNHAIKLWYDEIESITVKPVKKSGKRPHSLEFTTSNGTKRSWNCSPYDSLAIGMFISGMDEVCTSPAFRTALIEIAFEEKSPIEAESAGITVAAKETVNKGYEEEKFHALRGHGFAAERANHLNDKLHGRNARIVGDDNAKDGADRIVDGVLIQSKYCATGNRCIDSCFRENGNGVFRYIGKDGKPMVIEVPKDQAIYETAVERMRQKILNGQVPGITNPDEAATIVKQGSVTYKQAVNIAKAGTIDSIKYDSKMASVSSASAFGISATITFALSLWNNDPLELALKKAALCGLKVAGVAFATSVIASQLAKAGLNSALRLSSEAVIKVLGPKASAVLINAFRNGSNIYGAAAMKSAAKLLRNNVITAGATFAVLSLGDIGFIIAGRISAKQLVKDMLNTGAAIAGGYGGFLGGAAAGSLIVPGIGTTVGGIIGALGGGTLLEKGTNFILDKIIEDDAEAMVKIIETEFHTMAVDYLLNKDEAEKIIDKLSAKLNGKTLRTMFSKKDRGAYAVELLTPFVYEQVKIRPHIELPDLEEMEISIRELLEEIGDTDEGKDVESHD